MSRQVVQVFKIVFRIKSREYLSVSWVWRAPNSQKTAHGHGVHLDRVLNGDPL